MKIVQIYQLVNEATNEALGGSAVVSEDLSNVVDIGTAVFGANKVDNYVKSLVDHIGRVIFVNRPYTGSAPSVLMDKWEFGSVLEKIQCEMPAASENKSWELTDGTEYSPNVFYKPTVSAKFFNSKTTFEIDLSFTQLQVKESFDGVEQMNAFLSMLYNSVEKSFAVKFDSLIMSTINNATAQTLYSEFPSVTDGDYSGSDGVKAINLLKRYNATLPTDTEGATVGALTPEKAMRDPEFLRYASGEMRKYVARLGKMSTLFNIGEKARFTPRDRLHVVFLSDFVINMETVLQSDTFHNELTALPNGFETVPYWQGVKGSGTAAVPYGLDGIGQIHVNINGGNASGKGTEITNATGAILGVMFDNDALGVTNLDKRVTTHFNPKAEFYTNFYKMDAGYFNDLDENFIVFFVA